MSEKQQKARSLSPCRNCGKLPKFVKSDDPDYPVRLEHVSPTCPPSYGLIHYNSNKRNAAVAWNLLNRKAS